MMTKPLLFPLAACMALACMATAAQAQERSAMGNTDIQMSWSSLADQIDGFGGSVTIINGKVNEIVYCGKIGKVYSPGAPGADSHGCIEASSNSGKSMTQIVSDLQTLSNQYTALITTTTSTNTTLTSVLYCNKYGYAYNGAGSCVTISKRGGSCYLAKVTGSPGQCPSGYVFAGDTGGSRVGNANCVRAVCN